MSCFRERYLKLKNDAGLTTENMASLLGIGMASARAIETGYINPPAEIIVRLSDIFDVSLSYLFEFTDLPKAHEGYYNAKEIYVAKRLNGENGTVRAADIVGTIFIDRDEMHGKDFTAVVMSDDSMNKARIFKGDTLLVQKQSYADNGNVVVCVLENGDELVRTYHKNGNIVTLSAQGDNFKYPIIKIDLREEKFKIIGKVYEVRIKL